jgi:hypothetical protein
VARTSQGVCTSLSASLASPWLPHSTLLRTHGSSPPSTVSMTRKTCTWPDTKARCRRHLLAPFSFILCTLQLVSRHRHAREYMHESTRTCIYEYINKQTCTVCHPCKSISRPKSHSSPATNAILSSSPLLSRTLNCVLKMKALVALCEYVRMHT